jgi:hypothetical protein
MLSNRLSTITNGEPGHPFFPTAQNKKRLRAYP